MPDWHLNYVVTIAWHMNTNVHISVLSPHCAIVTHFWLWPFEKKANTVCIRALTWKEMGIILEQEDLSSWWELTLTSIIEIRWRAGFLLVSWHAYAGGCWINASLGYSAPVWVKSHCLVLLAKQTVLFLSFSLSLQPTFFPNLHIKHYRASLTLPRDTYPGSISSSHHLFLYKKQCNHAPVVREWNM